TLCIPMVSRSCGRSVKVQDTIPGRNAGVPGLLSFKTTVSGMVHTGAEGILTVPLPRPEDP
ncbi:MAG TPA: hypothetical protein VLL74_03710, partial [Methanoregula sp.]|nr:hypothetical protein [Methanoregula sp.]